MLLELFIKLVNKKANMFLLESIAEPLNHQHQRMLILGTSESFKSDCKRRVVGKCQRYQGDDTGEDEVK